MAYKLLLCILALVAVLDAIAIPPHHEVHEKRDRLHPRWTKLDRVEPQKWFQMRIGLTQTNLEKGYDHIMDVSDPASPNFGKHWTSEEVIATFQPSQETEGEVRAWLIENGIDAQRITHSDNKGWFAFYATAEEAENLLHAEFHEYEDSVTGGIMPACEQYHLPKNIREHIDYITPGIKLMAPAESHQSKKRNVEMKRKQDLEKRKRELEIRTSLETRNYALSHDAPPTYVNPNTLSTCDEVITPACVAALYQIPASTGNSSHPNNTLGIFESELQFWIQLDLDDFFHNFTGTNVTHKINKGIHPIAANIDGGQQSTTDLYMAGGEVDLDLMLAYPIVYPQKITLYQVDDFIVQANQNDTYTFGFNTFLDALDGSYCSFSAYNETGDDPYLDQQYPDPATGGWQGDLMCGVYKPTNVISLSYGGQEADVPVSYQKRQCLEYMKLGLQGVSFLFASGDSGVSNYPAPYGIDGPTGCLGPNLNVFNPTWPNGCPYVTNVGATKVYPGKTVFEPESAVYDPAGSQYAVNYSSGGGFSNVYPIPKYQASAVSTYFENHNPPYPYYSALAPDTGDIKTLPNITALAGSTGGIYNRIGRGIPDVSANGDNIAVFYGGNFTLSGGTSAATPIFASVINRINEERLNAGKGPIGTNPGCSTKGFSTAPGWDPVTGLGTPNYPKMLKYYLSLP